MAGQLEKKQVATVILRSFEDLYLTDLHAIIHIDPTQGTYQIRELTPAFIERTRYLMCSQVA